MATHTKIRAPAHWYTRLCTRHAKAPTGHGTTFDQVVLAVIVLNLVVLAWGLVDHDHENLVELADRIILAFFVCELALRLKVAGWQCWRDKWLWFDLIVIVLAILPLGADMLALRVVRGARLVHIGRHMPHLRHLTALRWVTWLARQAKIGQ